MEKYEIQVSPSQDNSGKRFSHGKSEAKMKNVILIFPSGLGKHFVFLKHLQTFNRYIGNPQEFAFWG